MVSPTGVIAKAGARGANDDPAQRATLKTAAAATPAPNIPLNGFDPQDEQRMLELANRARLQAGAPPLTLDAGLSRAARTHAEAMVAARQLSHQFAGEPSLPNRLAATSPLFLDRSGENVAFDYNAFDAHQHLMLSPHHRENLLNTSYNVVGLGVVRSGDRLYVVQDFGHALPRYSPAEAKERIATSVAQARSRARQPKLQRLDLANADGTACSMAREDTLNTSAIHEIAKHHTVVTYTALDLTSLPKVANKALSKRKLRSFSVGSCYARTETYPNGAYWMLLSLD
jgi:uncharacterized protein YkwD